LIKKEKNERKVKKRRREKRRREKEKEKEKEKKNEVMVFGGYHPPISPRYVLPSHAGMQ